VVADVDATAATEHDPRVVRGRQLRPVRDHTNRVGLATLFAPKSWKTFSVQILGPGHLPEVTGPIVMTERPALREIFVQSGGAIEVRIEPPAAWVLPWEVVAKQKQGSTTTSSTAEAVDLGRYRHPHLQPAHYELLVRTTGRNQHDHGPSGWSRTLQSAHQRVTVAEDETQVVTVDCKAWVPAHVEGRVLLDGKPPAGARILLRGARGDCAYGQFLPDAEGRFAASHVLPGSYRLQLGTGDFRNGPGSWVELEALLEFAPGERVEREFAFRSK
jgi:hypothetical protein